MHLVTATSTPQRSLRRVAMLGTHAPRRCGTATFTTDLGGAIRSEFPELDCFAVAMNDPGKRYAYSRRVRFEVDENDAASYRRAADFLNVSSVDVLSVQHEYGIFGGKAGTSVLSLLRELRMPIVTTLHTILEEPNHMQRLAMDELTRMSERVVVMSECGANLLRQVHDVSSRKIDVIPYGFPSPLSVGSSKDQLGLAGRRVILSFGLLAPDKGIEYLIDALPEVVARHPDVVYVLLGATHPHVKERQGETYRLMLEQRARAKDVDGHVIFHNRFVSNSELQQFLDTAEICVTPYLNMDRIKSGTLARAVGSGKVVVSTSYRYAKELLGQGRGVLLPSRDSAELGRTLADLLDDDTRRREIGQRAAHHAAQMEWTNVAHAYVESFQTAVNDHGSQRRYAFQARTLAHRTDEIPAIDLSHVRLLTDTTGILRHATYDVPRYEDGYSLDDNACALVAMTLIEEYESEDPKLVRQLSSHYLGFVRHAFNPTRGRFRDLMTYSRSFSEEVGSEESHARALWALGHVVGHSSSPGRRDLAKALFDAALPATIEFASPLAWALVLLGIDAYLKASEIEDGIRAVRDKLGTSLMTLLDDPNFVGAGSFSARLPHALLVTGFRGRDERMLNAGLALLTSLLDNRRDNKLTPSTVQSRSSAERAPSSLKQLPIEAAATIAACVEARRFTNGRDWGVSARRAFNWFLGENELQEFLYDPASGGCRDGLAGDRLTDDQGAEATLSFLLSQLEMRSLSNLSNASARSVLLVESDTRSTKKAGSRKKLKPQKLPT